jgi:inositol phosphorylceramide mannosyltransferase catalytic subunit
MIPKKIHQIYFDFYNKTFEENKLFVESANSFKAKNNSYEYKLWNEKDCEELINNNFPEYYTFYKNMKYEIQKVDFARYVILYVEGGFYADLDVICLKNIDNLINNNLIFHNVKEVYPNYSFIENDIMACEQNSQIFKNIIQEQEENYNAICKKEIYNIWKIRFILQTTGPKYLSRVVKKHLKNYKPFMNLVYTKKHIDKYDINNYYFQDHKSNSWVNTL